MEVSLSWPHRPLPFRSRDLSPKDFHGLWFSLHRHHHWNWPNIQFGSGGHMMVVADHRQWAVQLLGVPAEARPTAIRAAVRRCLTECDFAPSGALREAIAVVCERPAGELHYQAWREAELRGLVDELVQRASDLTLSERAAEWAALNAQVSGVPALQVRMKSLRTELIVGSDSDIASAPDDRVANLLFVARHIGVLDLSGQSAYCRRWERENIRRSEAERDAWLRAMNRFRAGYPDLYEGVETPFRAIETAIGAPQEEADYGSSAIDTGLVQSAFQFTADTSYAVEPDRDPPIVQLKDSTVGAQPLLFFIVAVAFVALLLNLPQDQTGQPEQTNGWRSERETIPSPGLREPGVSGYSDDRMTESDLRKLLFPHLDDKAKPRTKPAPSRSRGGDDVRRPPSN